MNARELLDGIQRGDEHSSGILCLKLFRVTRAFMAELRSDVERLCQSQLSSDVTRPEHITYWTRPFGEVAQFSLLNASGRYDDFSSDHNLSCFGKQFHGAQAYPALARLISVFPHLVNFRINWLGPRSGLSPHKEHALIRTRSATVGARLRFHLPITTNPFAELMVGGRIYHLDERTIYCVNHGCVHSAKNDGALPRIHLVWDMLLTKQAFECMFGDKSSSLSELTRLPAEERELIPLRNEHIGAYRQLSPLVYPEESSELDFCEPQ